MESLSTVFVLYLAINAKIQSKGYGSEIIKWLKEYAGQRTIVLNVEPIDDTAINAQQRQKRIAFYKKQGIVETDSIVCAKSVVQCIS